GVAQAHQDPAAAQARAREDQLQLPGRERLLGRALHLRLPVAAVPDLDGAATVLSLWDGALEVAVVEWMILHLHGETLVRRIERGSAGHRPGLEDSVELEPEIVVESARR